MTWLALSDVTKSFGKNVALKNLNLEISNHHVGIFGPNGSGKSTLLRILTGLIEDYEGLVYMEYPLTKIRFIPENPKLPLNYSIQNYLDSMEEIHGKPLKEVSRVLEKFSLNPKWMIKNLSAGQFRKVAILPIFFGEYDLLILDEPTNYLDIISRKIVISEIEKLLENTTIKLLIASHRIDEIRKFAQFLITLDNGELFDTSLVDFTNTDHYIVEIDKGDDFQVILDDFEIKYLKMENQFSSFFSYKIPLTDKFWNSMEEYYRKGGKIQKIRKYDLIDYLMEVYA